MKTICRQCQQPRAGGGLDICTRCALEAMQAAATQPITRPPASAYTYPPTRRQAQKGN